MRFVGAMRFMRPMRLAALVMGLAIGLAICEFGVRLAGLRPPPRDIDLRSAEYYPLEKNNAGFHDRDWSRAKPADTYRVIALGDSFTMGTMIPLEELFVKRAERALNERAKGPGRYEIMNLAFVGWDTSRELRALKEIGLAYAPDAVLVVFYVNDATGLDSNPRIIRQLNAYVNERDGWLNHWSRAWDYADYLLRRRRVTKQTLADYHRSFFGSEEQQVQWQRSKQALTELKAMSDRRGFRVGVVIFPMLIDLGRSHALSDIYELVEAHCETLGIPTLNLLPEYRGHTPESLWVSPSNAHPNVTANRIAGAAIEKFLVAASLVPDPDGEGWER